MSNVLPGIHIQGAATCQRKGGHDFRPFVVLPRLGAFQVAGVGGQKAVRNSAKPEGWHVLMMAPQRRARTGRGSLAPGVFWWAPYGETATGPNLVCVIRQSTAGVTFRYCSTVMSGCGSGRTPVGGGAASPSRSSHRRPPYPKAPPDGTQNSPLKPWGKALRRLFCVWFHPAGGRGRNQESLPVAGSLTDSGLANPSQPAADQQQVCRGTSCQRNSPTSRQPPAEGRPGGHPHKSILLLKRGRYTGPSGPLAGCDSCASVVDSFLR